MNCIKVRSLMLDYLYGELSPRKRRSVEKHLQTCADCPRELASYKATAATFRKLQMEEPTAELSERISAIALRDIEQYELLHTKRRRPYWKPALAAAAAALVVVVSIVYYLPQAAKSKMETQKLAAVKQGDEISQSGGSGGLLAKKEVARGDSALFDKDAEVSVNAIHIAGGKGSGEIAGKERLQSEMKYSAPTVAELPPVSAPAERTSAPGESGENAPEGLGAAAREQEAVPAPSAPAGAIAEAPKAVFALKQPMKAKSADVATDRLSEAAKPPMPTAQEEFSKANEDFYKRDFSSAVSTYQKVIDLKPKGDIAIEAKYRQGQSYQELHLYGKALAAYDEIMRDHPNFYAMGDIYLAAGDCYVELGRKEDALRSYEVVRDQFPVMREVAVQRIDRLSQQGTSGTPNEEGPEGK